MRLASTLLGNYIKEKARKSNKNAAKSDSDYKIRIAMLFLKVLTTSIEKHYVAYDDVNR